MKIYSTLLTMFVATCLPTASWADASDCYSIKNLDLKNHCLATTKQQTPRCYSIKDANLKHSCLATVGQQKSRCYSIKDKDQKQLCLANF